MADVELGQPDRSLGVSRCSICTGMLQPASAFPEFVYLTKYALSLLADRELLTYLHSQRNPLPFS